MCIKAISMQENFLKKMCRDIVFLIGLLFLIPLCKSFHNPVLSGQEVTNPSVIKYNGSFFMVSGGLIPTNNSWFPIHQSTNLQNWTLVGYVFKISQHIPWVTALDLAQPSLYYRQETGEFIVLFIGPASDTTAVVQIGVAKSMSIYGPFIPEPKHLNIRFGGNQFEPNMMSYNESYYLLWQSIYGITGMSINLDTLEVDNQHYVVLLIPGLEWEEGVLDEPRYVYRNNQHYILYQVGRACPNHRTVGIAKSSNILGPYTKLETPLLDYTLANNGLPSRANIVKDPNTNRDVIVYGWTEEVNCSPVKQWGLNINYIEWDTDGWPHVLAE